jgi:hypothetical protein
VFIPFEPPEEFRYALDILYVFLAEYSEKISEGREFLPMPFEMMRQHSVQFLSFSVPVREQDDPVESPGNIIAKIIRFLPL